MMIFCKFEPFCSVFQPFAHLNVSMPASIRLLILLLLTICWLGCDSSDPAMDEPDPEPVGEYTGLKTVAPYPVGVAFQSGRLTSTPHTQIVERVFSSLMAEYEMKMEPLFTGPGAYAWDGADALVDYAVANGLQVHGHTLVWHQTTPPWLENFSGDSTAFEETVRDYITTVVQRYQGKVVSWDVVNEAFEDGTGALRDSAFRRRMGPDFMARLFQYAHAADPDVLLFYNDYGTIWDPQKRAAMLAMIDDFQARGIPIDGVGLQVHITYNWPPLSNITDTMNELVRRGLKIHLSELDVRVNPDGDLATLTAARSQAQKERVKALVAAFNALPPENRFAITLWGLRDPESWLIDFWGRPDWPLLFDALFRPKPAYDGFLEALQEMP